MRPARSCRDRLYVGQAHGAARERPTGDLRDDRRHRDPDAQRERAARHVHRDARATEQPGFDLDILVVDSGSTDATRRDRRESHGVAVIERPARRLRLLEGAQRRHRRAARGASGDPVGPRNPARRAVGRAMTAPFEDQPSPALHAGRCPGPTRRGGRCNVCGAHSVQRERVLARQSPRGCCSATRPRASAERCGGGARSRFRPPRTTNGPNVWSRPAGRSIYEPDASVYHSHAESPRAQARRLIDVNRVITGDQRRTLTRTLRDAAGLIYRDGSAILALNEPLRRKIAHIADLLCVASFYVLDFSRAGTTAERRRRDS